MVDLCVGLALFVPGLPGIIKYRLRWIFPHPETVRDAHSYVSKSRINENKRDGCIAELFNSRRFRIDVRAVYPVSGN